MAKSITKGNRTSNPANKERRKSRKERSNTSDKVRSGKYSDQYDNRGDRGANDPSWYNLHHQLTLDAGNFSFNNPIGAMIDNVLPTGEKVAFPGIFTITVQHTPGISTTAFSPINVAARLLYDKINYKNSRNFTYDAPDLMMYVYAVSSVYAYHAYLRRIYGIMNTYSQVNRYIPDGILHALGVSAESVRHNMSQFRYGINLLARKVNALAVPAGMPLFERYSWLYSNVYMDAETVKAGLFLFKPFGFYKYYENGKKGGFCHLVEPPRTGTDSKYTVDDLINFGNDLIEALLASQDINNMSTDVLKACENNLVALTDTPEDYAILPVYNYEVLQQIHNIKMFGDYSIDALSQNTDGTYNVGSSGNVIQDPTTGYIKFTLENVNKANLSKVANTDVLIDTGKDNPTPDDVFVMTRLTPTLSSSGNVESCGTDIALYAELTRIQEVDGAVSYYTVGGNIATNYTFLPMPQSPAFKDLELIRFNLEAQGMWDKFDWAPFKHYFSMQDGKVKNAWINGDTYNYTSISKVSLEKLHETAILSEFAVPIMGDR